MCYLVRQQQPEFETGGVAQPPGRASLRPRWAGAAAALVFGGLALAGSLLTTPSMAPQSHDAKDRAGILPVAGRATHLPAGGVQDTSLPMDDGVPSTGTDVSKAGAGHCHHGL